MQKTVEYTMLCPLSFTAWVKKLNDWHPLPDERGEELPGDKEMVRESVADAATLYEGLKFATLAQQGVSAIAFRGEGLSMEVRIQSAIELAPDALEVIWQDVRKRLGEDLGYMLLDRDLVRWDLDGRDYRLKAVFDEDRLTQPEIVRPELVYLVVQEGGSSTEIYCQEFDILSEAQEYRLECERSAYRTSPIINIPRTLADAPGFSDAVQSALVASLSFEYPGEEHSTRLMMR